MSLQEAVEFQEHWNESDRRLAHEAIAWAQSLDPGIYAYIPPAREVAVVADSADQRLITFRVGHMRFHKRPPFAALRGGSLPGTWNLPLSRYRGD